MDIREATPDDHPCIRTTVQEAFGQDLEADLVEALRESGDVVLELVADTNHQILGHLLISNLRAPERCIALAPVSVLPSCQRRGVGSALIRAALQIMAERGWLAIFVLGEPEYYSRFGFSVEACAKFETEYPKTHMMALELQKGSLKHLSGEIAYADAFKDGD